VFFLSYIVYSYIKGGVEKKMAILIYEGNLGVF
jgi:hypothetical protein